MDIPLKMVVRSRRTFAAGLPSSTDTVHFVWAQNQPSSLHVIHVSAQQVGVARVQFRVLCL